MNNGTPDPDLQPTFTNRPENESVEGYDPTALLQTEAPKMSLAKKITFVLLVIVLIAGGIAGGILLAQRGSKGDNQAVSSTDSSKEKAAPLAPSTIAYFVRSQKRNEALQCVLETSQLQWQSATQADKAHDADIGADGRVGQIDTFGVYEHKVFFVTNPQCDQSGNAAVWYSADAGKTYTKVFDFGKIRGDTEHPAAITSARFSDDGKTIITGYLPSFGDSNVVMEIDPEAKSAKELFGVDRPGVFLQGYNREKGQALYFKGCYSCDAASFNELYSYNEANSTETLVFSDPGYVGFQNTFADGQSQLLRIKAVPANRIGEYSSYVLEEFDLADHTSRQLAVTDSPIRTVGYHKDGSVFYAQSDGVYVLGENGDAVNIYEKPSEPIYDVLYADEAQVLAVIGTYENRSVVRYSTKDKTETVLLQANSFTELMGVTKE